MKIEELKKKIQEKQENNFIDPVNKVRAEANKLLEKERTQVLEKMQSIADAVNAMAKDSTKGSDTLVRYLQYQEENSKGNTDRVSEISLDISQSIQQLIQVEQNKPEVSKNDLVKIIKNALREIENIFLAEQIPISGKVTMGSDNKLRVVEERYEGFSLITTFTRQPDGSFFWSTEKVNE